MDFVSLHSTGISPQNLNDLHLVNHLNLARNDLNDFIDVIFGLGLVCQAMALAVIQKFHPFSKSFVEKKRVKVRSHCLSLRYKKDPLK